MVTKLTSGREIELRPLTFLQRADIKDQALKHYRDNIPVSLFVCGKALMYATGISESELTDWPDEDIYEAGSKIFETLYVSETDKKK